MTDEVSFLEQITIKDVVVPFIVALVMSGVSIFINIKMLKNDKNKETKKKDLDLLNEKYNSLLKAKKDLLDSSEKARDPQTKKYDNQGAPSRYKKIFEKVLHYYTMDDYKQVNDLYMEYINSTLEVGDTLNKQFMKTSELYNKILDLLETSISETLKQLEDLEY